MTVALFCYVDNQEVSQYPIDYIYKKIDWVDKKYLFVSDEVQQKLLGHVDATFVRLGIRIEAPQHIGHAQEASLQWLKANDDSDFFLMAQASKMILPSCRDKVAEVAVSSNRRSAFKYGCGYVRAYCRAYIGMFGCLLIGRDCSDHFNPLSDGAPSSFQSQGEPPTDDWKVGVPNRTLDIGYFSTVMAARHTLQNARLWHRGIWIRPAEAALMGDMEPFLLKLYQEVREYNHGILDLINPEKDPLMSGIMDDLKLWDDYAFAKPIAQRAGAVLL